MDFNYIFKIPEILSIIHGRAIKEYQFSNAYTEKTIFAEKCKNLVRYRK